MRKIISAVVMLIPLTSISFASSECERLKDLVTKASITEVEKTQALSKLRQLISVNDLCAKNLLGRLTYKGRILPEDIEKAYAIFYDLAHQGYPPATYNLAYFYIAQKSLPPDQILDLLKGIMGRFAGDPEWGNIAADARELGWEYIYAQLAQDPNSPQLIALAHSFNEVSNSSVLRAAQIAVETRNSYHAAGNVIIGLMALGAAVSMASNAMSASVTTYANHYTIPPPSPKYFSLMSTPTPGTYYLYAF